MSFVKTTAAVIVFTPLTASIMWFALGFAPSNSCAAPTAKATTEMASAPEDIVVLEKPNFEELIKLMPAYVRAPLSNEAPSEASEDLPPLPRQKPRQAPEKTIEDIIALAEAGL